MKLIREFFKKEGRTNRIITAFVFLSLILSAVYATVNIILSDPGAISSVPHERMKSDYTLILVQCLLGMAVMFLPNLLEKRLRITIPNASHIAFVVFLYCAIYLGEVRKFYYTVSHWDTVLHAFSAVMLGAAGFSVVDLLNSHENVNVRLAPKFVALFAFCFALSFGALWEIYEFAGDNILGLNMQKYAYENGVKLIGQAALFDTMKDIIVDAFGSLAMAIFGYFSLKKRYISEKAKQSV